MLGLHRVWIEAGFDLEFPYNVITPVTHAIVLHITIWKKNLLYFKGSTQVTGPTIWSLIFHQKTASCCYFYLSLESSSVVAWSGIVLFGIYFQSEPWGIFSDIRLHDPVLRQPLTCDFIICHSRSHASGKLTRGLGSLEWLGVRVAQKH